MQQRIIIYYIRGIKGRELEPEEREGRQEEEDEEGGWVGGLGFNQLICHAKQAGRQADIRGGYWHGMLVQQQSKEGQGRGAQQLGRGLPALASTGRQAGARNEGRAGQGMAACRSQRR